MLVSDKSNDYETDYQAWTHAGSSFIAIVLLLHKQRHFQKQTHHAGFLINARTRKRYVFQLKIGQIQTIYVTGVDGQRVTGYLYPNGHNKKNKIAYDERFENIIMYVAKISERKIDPVKTTVAIVVPAAVIIPMVIVIFEGGLVSMTF